MVLLISYDLDHNKRPQNYERVRQLITQHAISVQKPLYSQWLVETDETPDAWTTRLRAVVADADEFLLVVQVRRPYQGWLPSSIWDWLNERVV
jgi:CRISPR-associated endonuclease Cas2